MSTDRPIPWRIKPAEDGVSEQAVVVDALGWLVLAYGSHADLEQIVRAVNGCEAAMVKLEQLRISAWKTIRDIPWTMRTPEQTDLETLLHTLLEKT